MKAHLFLDEEGGMVTGTDDVRVARRLIVAEYLDRIDSYSRTTSASPSAWDDPNEVAYASRRFRAREARVETGRCVPAERGRADGYKWFWRSGYEPGKPGVTTAVVWS